MISLPALITRAAQLNPQGLATRFDGRELTWCNLAGRIAHLAAGLQSFGLDSADRVAILSLNSDRFYEVMFAISWAGYTMVPLNTRWALPENEYAIADSQSRILFFDNQFADQAQLLLAGTDNLIQCIYMGREDCPLWAIACDDLIANHPQKAASSRGDNDMAGIFYTGGTTGFPKGVMQSHHALWASAMGTLSTMGMTRESVYLHVAPMFHMADIAGSMVATLSCARHVMLTHFDPETMLKTLSQEKISHVMLVPAMIKALLNHPNATTTDVSYLKGLLYGASPMPAEVLKQCLKIWPSVGLIQAYGQTELAPVVTMLSVEDHIKGGERLTSAGRPTPVNEVRIVDDNNNDCPLGVTGEIAVRGPHAMLGYWNKPEETAQAMRDGWVFTGDAGYFNEEGYLFIADRVKDMIISGGENIYTTEVENAVISHPFVQDVAVIGIPDDEWGETVHAIVILHPDKTLSQATLISHCREKIAGYKLPKSVDFRVDPLPLSGAGKVLKTQLREPFWQNKTRQVN